MMPSRWLRLARRARTDGGWLLPALCEVCGRWPGGPVCDACRDDFADAAPRCPRCAVALSPLAVAEGRASEGLPGLGDRGAPTGSDATAPPGRPGLPTFAPFAPFAAFVPCATCRASPPAFDACACAVAYAYPWDGLIARFKFGGEPGWASTFAALMRARPAITRLLGEAEVVVPMPLAAGRLAERGYNQALQLARQLAPRRRLHPGLLRRVRETGPQSALPPAQRRHNIAGAFAVDAAVAATIQGRHLLLVDDVMTSGATLHEAALALRRAGAGRVSAVVLARTDLS